MATKTTARKATTTKRAASTTTRKAPATASKGYTSSSRGIKYVTCEANPDAHKVTGKFTFFYVFFAVTTLVFAGISALLIKMNIDSQDKLDDIISCYTEDSKCTLTNKKADVLKNGENVEVIEEIVSDNVAENAE